MKIHVFHELLRKVIQDRSAQFLNIVLEFLMGNELNNISNVRLYIGSGMLANLFMVVKNMHILKVFVPNTNHNDRHW